MLESLKGYRTFIVLGIYFANAWAVNTGYTPNADELVLIEQLQSLAAHPLVGLAAGYILRLVTDTRPFSKS